ncbi:MAG: replication restart helicase PriA [Bryobacteraceae bacterium]
MSEGGLRYCDVALPVPVDRLFTYSIPPAVARTLVSAASAFVPMPGAPSLAGCRVEVPFGSRKLTGVVLRVHDEAPAREVREVLRVVDAEPVLDGELLRLGRWMSEYYCAPVGEVFKGMLPLSGERRRNVQYALTDLGRSLARQLTVTSELDPAARILSLLEDRPRTAAYLTGKVAQARAAVRALIKRGCVVAEENSRERDPLRASAERLEVEFPGRPKPDEKLAKSERELLAFLELHPGRHNLAQVGAKINRASEAARALGRRGLLKIEAEGLLSGAGYERPVPELNPDQSAACAAIAAAIAERRFQAFLLQGVTGSGKTEVYLRSIEATLAAGRNALLLVPEIGLTPAVAGQFFHRFGDQAAILHSAFGDAERAGQWRRIRDGRARVVVGTRSGVFAPVRNLGLVVVDEEHDGSYKQQETPRYHGRDVALMRAKEADAAVVLGSATPSIETRWNADREKYTMLSLPERIARRPLPRVEVVDMRTEFLETRTQAPFSRKLVEEMTRRLERREQTLLLLNRRGFSSFMVCRACGERLQCANCSVVLTHHRGDRRMLCHYCGYAEKIPAECPKCGSDYVQFLGTGSERAEEELHRHFAEARIARLDRDTASGKGAFERILQQFRDGEIDILVGTQMIAKGHDVPNVTLVGVVLADIGLSMPDFRAAERSFQLLTQAAGRAGRGATPGEVVIQTLNPDHYAIRFAAEQNYEGFYSKESGFRKWLRYPPYAVCANVLVRAQKQEDALRMATQLGYELTPAPDGVRVMGPAEAPVVRLRDEFRYQIFLKAAARRTLRQAVNKLRSAAERQKWNATALTIDIDPISLM